MNTFEKGIHSQDETPPKVEQQKNFSLRIQELRELFYDSPDNLYVKGSYVRGDAPYGDIDIMIFNQEGKRLAQSYPEDLDGVPFSFSTVPSEHLEEYLKTCIRGMAGLLEAVEIHADEKVRKIVEEQKVESMEKRLDDYILFLYIEESIDEGKILFSSPGTAPYLKRFPGGKRTASRIIWMIKAMHPELYAINGNTTDVLAMMVEKEYLDQDTADDIQQIFSLTKPSPEANVQFEETAKRIRAFFSHTLIPQAKTLIKDRLDPQLVEAAETCLRKDASPEELKAIYEFALHSLETDQRWMIMFALAAHPNTSQEIFQALYEKYKGSIIYRHIIRNLLRNKSFDIGIVDPKSLENFSLALYYYNKRKVGQYN